MSGRGVKRALRVSGGVLVAAGACAAVAAGGLGGAARSAASGPSAVGVGLLASALVLVTAVVARRLRFVAPSVRAQRVSFWLAIAPACADVEVALALVAGAYASFAVSGGLSSPLYPLLYGVVAFSVTFQSRAGAWATLVAAALLEAAAAVAAPGHGAWVAAAVHLGFIAAAALAHAVFLRALVAHARRRHRERLDAELTAQRESARDYRLIAAALGAESRPRRSRTEEELKLAVGAVETISASIYYTLGLLKQTLAATTCVLLWLDERGEALKIKELVTDSDDVTEAPAVGIAGAVGAVVRDRAQLTLPATKPGQVPYYEPGTAAGAFVGVPVMDGPHMRGVLCADRGAPFDDADAAFLAESTEQILRAIQSERVFAAVERAKYEHERFYKASAMLCRALTLEQVMGTAFDAAAEIVDYDAAAITIYDPGRKRHRVYSVRLKPGSDVVNADALGGLEFRENSGLASMVVKNKHYLPAAGELRDTGTFVYTRRIKFKSPESLLVLPLLSADEAIGTFMLASKERHRFGKDVREMLGIIANQVAVSLQNALMYRRMETMATTDGLTGLTNHRTFQERFADLLERAERHGHQAALLLCDVDHFKNVNDTYGHPVGDEVLRRVARVLQDAVRKIDIPARYGGEEFVVVLEATDLDGAVRLANRIREDVAKLEIESDKGPFGVTISVGVSAFPHDSRDRALLIERADMALYHAKESGRNRVVPYREFLAARRARKAS